MDRGVASNVFSCVCNIGTQSIELFLNRRVKYSHQNVVFQIAATGPDMTAEVSRG